MIAHLSEEERGGVTPVVRKSVDVGASLGNSALSSHYPSTEVSRFR